jgi:hypothetical protein
MDADRQRALEESLELMPRSVRDKLDRVEIKLHLAEWQQLTLEERERLRDQACDSSVEIERYREVLEEMVCLRCGKAPDRLRR